MSGAYYRKNKKVLFSAVISVTAAVLLSVIGYILILATAEEGGVGYKTLMGLTLVFGLAMTCLIALLAFFKGWSIKKLFPLAALSFGLIFIFLIPAYGTPDEKTHYLTAYNLSNEMLGVPLPEDGLTMYMRQCDNAFDLYFDDECDYDTYLASFCAPQERNIQLVEVGKASSWNFSGYYLQAAGITLARVLKLNFGWTVFFGSLFNMLVYVLMSWYAICKLPYGKRTFFVIAMLPITLQQTSSLSYDAPILAATAVITALSFAWRERTSKPKTAYILLEILMFAISILVLQGVKKGAYLIFVFLPVVTLWPKFKERVFHKWFFWVALGLVVALALIYVFVSGKYASLMETLYTPAFSWYYFSYLRPPIYYLQHPAESLQMIFTTLLKDGKGYVYQMLGGILGSLNILIFKPIVWANLLLLLVSLIRMDKEKDCFNVRQRIWLAIAALIPDFLCVIAMMVYWTPDGYSLIQGIQGRYFIPTMLVLLFALGRWNHITIKNADVKWMENTVAVSSCLLTMAAVISVFVVV